MSEWHEYLIIEKLKAFCFSLKDSKAMVLCSDKPGAFGWPQYLVFLKGPLGVGVIRCQIVNDLYCEARVLAGAA